MAFQCGAPTASGGTCRSAVSGSGSRCGWHTVVSGEHSQCPICMEDIYVRNCKKLPCEHNFHKKCLDKWKMEGNRTCPLCREPFDLPQFRVKIEIDPINDGVRTYRSRTFEEPNVIQHIMESSDIVSNDPNVRTELTLEAEDIQSLRRVLEQIGISLTVEDYDSLTSVPHDVSEL